MHDFKKDDYDEVWFIIRSITWMKNKEIFDDPKIYHVPELSPSSNLFFAYLALKKENKWNKESFDKNYVPEFIKGINNENSREKLNLLWKKSKDKKILIICPCQDESLCHRSVVGGILSGAGAEVISLTGNISDYLKYHNMFKVLDKK